MKLCITKRNCGKLTHVAAFLGNFLFFGLIMTLVGIWVTIAACLEEISMRVVDRTFPNGYEYVRKSGPKS